jgi:hypothetical protein
MGGTFQTQGQPTLHIWDTLVVTGNRLKVSHGRSPDHCIPDPDMGADPKKSILTPWQKMRIFRSKW